jgi:hypothetical protein
VGTGDFNGDQTDDIFWKNADGLVGIWLMGNGTRQATFTLQNMAGWNVIATGDFNADGVDDVIWRSDTGFIGGWLMANGQIAGTLQLPFFPGWQVVATGDFNADGNTDLLWRNDAGQLGEWLMANGTRSATLSLGSMPGWDVIAAGDFNGDGADDLMWRNSSGDTAAWLMDSGTVAGTLGYGSTLGFHVVASGDFDGNGTGDVAWQNGTSGAISTWLMNASGRPNVVATPVSGAATAPAPLSEAFASDSVIVTDGSPALLYGSNGADVFQFLDFTGDATIHDFDLKLDRIAVDQHVVGQVQDILQGLVDDLQGNTVVGLDPHTTITLIGIDKSQLLAEHFALV